MCASTSSRVYRLEEHACSLQRARALACDNCGPSIARWQKGPLVPPVVREKAEARQSVLGHCIPWRSKPPLLSS
eukprot:903042-Lingulodinium_polyedra.AAC.1